MPPIKSRNLTLACITAFTISACNLQTIQPDYTQSSLNSKDNFLNLLDPDIKSEEQAFAKAEVLFNEGKSENALFYYIKTLQFNKNNVKALERIATIHSRNNHPELAIKIYKDILAIDNNNILANENLGLYLLENGQTGKAKQHLSVAVKYNPNSWKAHNGLGVIADLEHNTDEAIAQYEAALEIEPSNPMLLNNLGYSHYLAGNNIKAKQLFTQALNYDNKYNRAIHNLALIEIKNGNFPTATALFNRIMSVHESYNNIGYICMLNGQYAAAEEYLRRAIDESPVYFPKAQENLKTLMSLKRGTLPYEPPIEPAAHPVPIINSIPKPAQNQSIQPKSQFIKPSTLAKDPINKNADKQAVTSKKKSASKQVVKTTPAANSDTIKKETAQPEPAAKLESQPQTINAKPALDSEVKKVESTAMTAVPVSENVENNEKQSVSDQAKVITPSQDTSTIKSTEAKQRAAQPVLPLQETIDNLTSGTASEVAETKIEATASSAPHSKNQQTPSEPRQMGEVPPASQEVNSSAEQPTVSTESKPTQPDAKSEIHSLENANKDMTKELVSVDEKIAETPAKAASQAGPSSDESQPTPSDPTQADLASKETSKKIAPPVDQADVNMDSKPSQPAVNPEPPNLDTKEKVIENTETSVTEPKTESQAPVKTDAKREESNAAQEKIDPAAQEPKK